MNILISLLGSTLDSNGKARGLSRWNVWRPSVALAMQNDLHFDRYHLIYQPKFEGLKERIVEDIKQCSPSTEVIPEAVFMDDPWDFEEVYSKLYEYSRNHDFSGEEDHYYIHITTGSHVAQICLFLLTESHHLPGKLIQTLGTHIGDIDVTHLTIGSLRHLADILLYPIVVVERILISDGAYNNLASARSRCGAIYAEFGQDVSLAYEQLIYILYA